MCPILITDVGTTICKSIVFEHDGVSIGKSAQGYITKRPNPLWAQQDPNTWWQSFKLTSKTALKKTRTRPNGIDCIGIIGMGHGPVLLNSRGRPIMPCLIWPDLRATRQAEELRAKVKDLGIEHSISGRVQAWYTAAKLLWIRQNYPRKFKEIHKVILPKDYIRFKLSGSFVTDFTDATGTQLFDIRRQNWSETLLEYLQLSQEQLPEIRRMEEIAGEVTGFAARETGLRAGTPVLTGSTDWGTAPMALGKIAVGDGFIYAGTAPCFGISIDREVENSALYGLGLSCDPYYQLHGRWMLGGALSAAGAALTWYNEQFENVHASRIASDRAFKKLERQAAEIEPGSDGLVFLPHVMGERCPENPDARAVLYGLSLGHTRSHISRAIQEGIAFAIRSAVSLAEEKSKIRLGKVIAYGGGVKSKLLAQIIANVLGKTLLLPAEQEIGALGLAIAASATLDGSPMRNLYSRKLEIASEVTPQTELKPRYEAAYGIFRCVDGNLIPTFAQTA